MYIALREVLAELRTPAVDNPAVTEFLRIWPDQAQNVLSYQGDPECSCAATMQVAMVADENKLRQFLEYLYAARKKTFVRQDDPEAEPVRLAPVSAVRPATPPPVQHMAGQVRVIADTAEAYTALIANARKQNMRYTGLAVTDAQPGFVAVLFY